MGDRNSLGSETLSNDLQNDDENRNGGTENGDTLLCDPVLASAISDLPVAGTEHELLSTALASKLLQLREEVSVSREDVLELRQRTSDLQEYLTAKIIRVCRYLGVLAEKAHKLDQVVLEGEAQLSFMRNERRKLFNDLFGIKGNIQVYCRVRPRFGHEGPSVVELLNEFSLQITASSSRGSTSKWEFEFDRIYGPQVSQGDFFHDIQPFVQSALDGYNVCVIAYGQSGSGKTYTIEGPTNDRGVIYKAFEELLDLSNNEMTSASRFSFALTMFELDHEVVDLLGHSVQSSGTDQIGYNGKTIKVSQEQVQNLADFAKIYSIGLQNRRNSTSKIESLTNPTHLVVTFHIHYNNNFSGEKKYSKLSIVDMVASERLPREDSTGDRLGDVLSALTVKQEYVPYENSLLTQILADSLGGDCKTLLIVNLSPCQSDVQETLETLHFGAKARNMGLGVGNRDTIKKLRDMANKAQNELNEKENEVLEMQHQMLDLKKSLKRSEDQCLLLFNEVQKAWKVAFSLQADHKNQTAVWIEKEKNEKEQNSQLKAHISQLMKSNEEQKRQLQDYMERIQYFEGTVQELNQQLKEARQVSVIQERDIFGIAKLRHIQRLDDINSQQKSHVISEVTKRLEEELSKRDELIERLHEENEKLFERLTDKRVLMGSSQVQNIVTRNAGLLLEAPNMNSAVKIPVSLDKRVTTTTLDPSSGILTVANDMSLTKSGAEKVKTTPAGEYLTGALNDFNPDPSDASASADGANKLLMLVLAAVIKAGAAREHEMLAEIRNAVFAFIRKMEPLRVMDTMLVSRVRILYIRSLLSRTQELQMIKVPPVDRFLEKVGSGSSSRSRSSQGSSPARSPVQYERNFRKDIFDDQIQPFKVYIKQEKRSRFSSIVLKLRGIDQETWRQHVTGGKIRETTEEARNFAIGNKALAALFVHTPAGELQRQIRNWLAESFDFISLSSGDVTSGTAGQLELLSTAIMDGWMSGLGVPQRPTTDALGQLLSDYTKRVYTSQLQRLKDVAATLATEEADDLGHISRLRSSLEAVEHKRRKILQQMRSDVALLTKEEGGSPIRNPSTASEDARIASLMSLEDILRHAEELKKEAPVKAVFSARKQFMLSNLQALYERLPSLLSIDHPCAQRHILEAQRVIESVTEQRDGFHHTQGRPGEFSSAPTDWTENLDSDIMQWSVLQFNTGAANPFVIKCSATASLELVVKAQAKIEDKGKKEMVSIVPAPSTLTGLSLEEIKQMLARLPEAFSQLALTKSADGTRARYARLYKTLATRVPALKNTMSEADREYSRDFSNASMSFKRVG